MGLRLPGRFWVDGLTIEVSDVTVQLNQPDVNGRVLDFVAAPLEVATGPGGLTMTLDMDGADGALLIGDEGNRHGRVSAYAERRP